MQETPVWFLGWEDTLEKGNSSDLDGKGSAVVWETQVWSLGQKDPLKKEMATHSSTLGWKIQWMEKPGGLQSMGSQRVGHN